MQSICLIRRLTTKTARPLAAVILLLVVLPGMADGDWSPAGKQRGVTLEAKRTSSGHRAYRGAVLVCTDLAELQRFVADASRLEEWIPYTEAAWSVPDPAGERLYYMRTSAPWPFRSRDMVYRLSQEPSDGDGPIHIDLEGVPDALPEKEEAVRMRSADGRWTLTRQDGGIEVALRLTVDPGPAPAFFANRRLAATVAGTLSNLAAQFPCPDGS